MLNFVTATELPGDAQLVDVRTPSEFSTGHIAGAVNLPLDQIESRTDDLSLDRPLVLICKGGTRARMAAELLAPCRSNTVVLEGGMNAWLRGKQPVVVSARTRWSLERQVRLVAGLLVIAAIVAARFVHPAWIFLAAFVGLGLTFAGLTDICGMGLLLARLPWNRQSKLIAKRESGGSQCVVRD